MVATRAPVLTTRALNRALLARQLLLERADLSVIDAVEHLVGLQAQAPDPPYYALWARLAGFRTDDLAERLVDRSVVRIVVMRGTVHLLSAADCLALRPLAAPILEADLRTNTTYGPPLAGLDLAAVAAAGRDLLAREPRTAAQLRPLLAERWPDRDPAALAHTLRNLLPLVQVPPRGVWGKSGQPTYATAESWLGKPLDPEPSPARMILRYLRAYGPATVADVQTWSGLRGLREVVEELRPRLRTFADERGRELFDVPDAPLPDPDTPAPVRLTAPFDNLVLSHADRTRIISEPYRKRLFFGANGVFPGQLLVDGYVAGSWRIDKKSDTARVTIEPYHRLPKRQLAIVRAEGNRLLRFAAPAAAERTVEIIGDGQRQREKS